MSRVIIRKSGLFEVEWDGERRVNVLRRVKRSRVLSKLRLECKLAKDVTLIDIFRMVASYPTLKRFIAEYSWCWCIDELHAQAEEPIRTEDDERPIDYLVVSWSTSYKADRVINRNKTKSGYFNNGLDFRGVGTVQSDQAVEGLKKGDLIENYSVSMTPMYDIADCPVRLDTG